MKFRKLLLSIILVASQVAMVLPGASAETQNGTINEQISGQGDTGSSLLPTNDTSNQDQSNNSGQNGTEPVQNNQNSDQVNSPSTSAPANLTPASPVPTQDLAPPVVGGNTSTPNLASQNASLGQLTLMLNSDVMYQNGVQYKSAEPMAVKNGVSYVAIRSLVDRVGLAIRFDNETQETVITRGSDELRFKVNSNTYNVNGVVKTMKGASYSTKSNVFMVPFTSITEALKLPYKLDTANKRILLDVSTKPKASFTVSPKDIIAGQTQVNYITSSTPLAGTTIVNEEWTGRQDIFAQPGSYVVTYRVQDSSGQWSDPYSLTINVVKPHTPPVAAFSTDKDTYKMGEMVTYTDQSTDEENSITKTEWDNNKLAFFTPGPQTIRVKVTNKYGLTSTAERTINITSETLYSESDFNKLFVPVGNKYLFEGTQVPTWDRVNYTFTTEPVTLIRSNSPETNYSEGILYRETSVGSARFMIHHQNSTGKDMKMYVIASNNNDTPANLYINTLGFGGPNADAATTGKVSVQRYFNSILTRSDEKQIPLAPGQQKIVLDALSTSKMKPDQVVSLLSDVYTDYPVQFDVIMIDASKDPLTTLPQLSVLPRDGVHNRGTYPEANRIIQYDEVLGDTPKRLLLGDNVSDPFQPGLDTPNNTEARNAGNFGVLYTIHATKVAPHTLITFNPRGGFYVGEIMVNGNIVDLPKTGGLNAPNDAAVLYRTGDTEETVHFVFTAAPGSNLSVNLLFQPLPQVKTQ